MKSAFLGQAYQARSPVIASQTAINIYPELVEAEGSEVGGFIGTPGLSAVVSTTPTEARGIYVTNSFMFVVAGANVYRYDSEFNQVLYYVLPESTGRVSMTDNGTQILIAHSSGWHVGTMTVLGMTAVTGAPISSIVGFIDNYAIFPTTGGTFGISKVGDFSTISALDVATAEGSPDDLLSILIDHREVWLFGTETIEIWGDTGASFFPFERAPGGFIEQGCAAKYSPAKIDNSVFWLSKDKSGRGMVFRSNGYIPQRISTHAIEYAINTYADISDAFAFTYQEEGHSFYVITFPSGDATWVYDVATKGWHQRMSFNADQSLHRWRVTCHGFFNQKHYVSGLDDGYLYLMSLDLYRDGPYNIYRERAWEAPNNENKKMRIDFLELEALTGDGDQDIPTFLQNTVSLDYSIDSGKNFAFKRQRTLGLLGQTTARVRWRRLGTGRGWVFRISTSMNNRVHWANANIRGEIYDQ